MKNSQKLVLTLAFQTTMNNWRNLVNVSTSFPGCSYVIRCSRSRMNTLVHFDEMRPESGCIWKPLWISQLARQRQTTENGRCSGLILHKMNGEIENKHFEDLI